MESTIDRQLMKMRGILEQQERDKGKGNGTLGALLGALGGAGIGGAIGKSKGDAHLAEIMNQVKTAPKSVAKSTALGAIPGVHAVQLSRMLRESGVDSGKPVKAFGRFFVRPGNALQKMVEAHGGKMSSGAASGVTALRWAGLPADYVSMGLYPTQGLPFLSSASKRLNIPGSKATPFIPSLGITGAHRINKIRKVLAERLVSKAKGKAGLMLGGAAALGMLGGGALGGLLGKGNKGESEE